MAPSRRQAGEFTISRNRTTAKETAASGKVEDYFPAYDDFKWDEIAVYLQTLFPHWSEYNQKLADDNWVFEIPRALNAVCVCLVISIENEAKKFEKDEKAVLRQKRDARKLGTSDSTRQVSPE